MEPCLALTCRHRNYLYFRTYCFPLLNITRYEQFHRFNEAALRVGLPFSSFIGPGIPFIRAQKEALRPLSAFVLGLGAGALSFDPVAALYLARPAAVRPAPLDTGSFSPLPTDNDTDFFFAMSTKSLFAACVSMHRLHESFVNYRVHICRQRQ